MSYRDDVDTLYSRALVLQRELDAAQKKLVERETELAEMKGERQPRAETSPGIRELRSLPDPHRALERLVDTSRPADNDAKLVPVPMPDWAHIVKTDVTANPVPLPPRTSALIERVRNDVEMLSEDDLLLVAKIVDEFTDGKGNDELLRSRLRWLASELAVLPH